MKDKNPPPSRQIAIALKYDVDNDPAPAVVAKGRGHVAEKLLALAEKHKIPIRQDHALAETLGTLELGDYIPEEFFPAIAEILAYIFAMNKKYSRHRAK